MTVKPDGVVLSALRQLPTEHLVSVGASSLAMQRVCEQTGQVALACAHSVMVVLTEFVLFERVPPIPQNESLTLKELT